jgi:hypothetical protein
MEPTICTHYEKFMKIIIELFPMIFQSLMGLRKSKCDVLSGTTQGCFCHFAHKSNLVMFVDLMHWLEYLL